MDKNKNRNISLDLMRFLGVLTIMVAHANPPDWLFQLRNFGTPLLVVASALTYSVIYSNRQISPYPFWKKRVWRLVVPTWIFLTIFFCFFWVVTSAFNKQYPFSLEKMLTSYSFYSGIGFVWIFKIYLILALITPLALKIRDTRVSNGIYFVVLAIFYCLYEGLLHLTQPHLSQQYQEFVNRVIFFTIPYALLYFYGMRLGSLSNRQIVISAFCSFCLFAGLATSLYMQEGSFVPTQEFKYPPRLYYLVYAICFLNLIYLGCRSIQLTNFYFNRAVVWLSSNSLWIYLWHIMAWFVWDYIFKDTQGFLLFVCKAIFLLGFGVLATVVQKHLVLRFFSNDTAVGSKVISVLA